MPRAHGFDVSHWNAPSLPDVVWRFLIAKASEGLNYADPTLSHWRRVAADAHKLFGTYHFARPDAGNDATAEADWYVKVAAPRPGELVVLDIELHGPSPSQWVNTWCTRVHQRTGARVIVYTNRYVGDTLAGCGHHPLWIADPGAPAASPRLPAPWTRWVIHQYGSLGGVDRDVAAGTVADVLRPLAVPADPGTQPPPPTPAERRLGLIRRIRRLLRRLARLS